MVFNQVQKQQSTTDGSTLKKFLNWLYIFIQKKSVPLKNEKSCYCLTITSPIWATLYWIMRQITTLSSFQSRRTPHIDFSPWTWQSMDQSKNILKSKWIPTFRKAHLGRIINQYDVAKLFTNAYLKGATPANAVSGFHASGIYPLNKHAIGEEHFAPSEIYQFAEQPGTETLPEKIV